MIVQKDGIKYKLEDTVQIEAFLSAGWTECEPETSETERTETKTETSKNTKGKR